MGLALEFIIGDDKQIVEAAKELDFDILDNNACVTKKADFTLHLTPKDLNTLSILASRLNKQEPIHFREYLELIIDEEDHGLFKVNDKWIEYFSKVEFIQLEELAYLWYSELQRQYKDEDVQITIDGIQAVKDLGDICKFAIKHEMTVFHLWYL